MFVLDDRTGNVLTTIALFAAVAAAVVAAKATIVVFVLALLLAYLLEPAVAWLERRLPARPNGRAAAIALVYLAGVALAAIAAYTVGPPVAAQVRRLSAAVTGMLAPGTGGQFFTQHRDAFTGAMQRVNESLSAAAQDAAWLLLVPVVAVFFLQNRATLIDGAVDLFAHRRDRASVKRTVERIDTMLAQYARAQLLLAALSVAFYSVSAALLGFPYPIALGLLGGAFEFVPVGGWLMAASVILTSGWLAHANWIAMSALIVVWRGVQNFVNSPRIMGNQLQMEPMTVFFALLAGGQVGGLLGILLAVPAAAVLRILWLERSSSQTTAAA